MLQTFAFSSLDYTAAFQRVFPSLLRDFSTLEPAASFADILSAYPKETESAGIAAMNLLPQDRKNQLTVCAIGKHQDQLISLITSLTQLQKLPVTPGGISRTIRRKLRSTLP